MFKNNKSEPVSVRNAAGVIVTVAPGETIDGADEAKPNTTPPRKKAAAAAEKEST